MMYFIPMIVYFLAWNLWIIKMKFQIEIYFNENTLKPFECPSVTIVEFLNLT